jgi:glycosyltransferase involved in cell wall biosynthesis
LDDFSLVIPYFNGEGALKRAIGSVESQICKPVEIIIVDDGSDNPLEHWQLAGCAIPVKIVRIENSGQSVARNLGVSLASTEYVAFLLLVAGSREI